MCGITGIYAFNLVGQVNMINLAAATQALASRGPDFQNTFNNTFVGLGHRRLSVIDLRPEAHQPMTDSLNRYYLIYNGEIYNYKELKKPLQEKGYVFKSESDTEVLLYHLIEKGKEGIADLNGFFSFAFYDSQQDEILLSIDRAGIKPLYYLFDQDKFIFSSEMKSLLQYGLEKKLDVEALTLYFQLNYVPGPKSILKGIEKLKPGHYIKLNRQIFERKPWFEWNLNILQQPKITQYDTALEKFRSLMEASVERRLVADVPVGTFLSGGIDSSIISLVAKKIKPDIESFSIGFDKSFFDESDYAKEVAEKIGTRHHTFTFTYEKFNEVLFMVLDYIDEPFADSSAIAYYLLSYETRKFSTVALSGDGADELFGGYNKHLAFAKSMNKNIVNTSLYLLNPLLKLLPGSRHGGIFNTFRQIKRYSNGLWKSPENRYWDWASFQDKKKVEKMFQKGIRLQENPDAYNEVVNSYKEFMKSGNAGLDHFLLSDMQLILPWDMLTKVDRMSMANSLEVRVPFLDPEMIQYAFQLPENFKIQGNQRKRILYDAYKEELPERLYHRPKKGFEVPL
ncbi:MAG: asparagine synthase (glutamine-hydrolyzing), partial [Cyclobacteriaceae bacterium]|nr:asparagine synthase (glutamine-hydrolyzing) [Cyclobacteriaceae bacterium]